MALSGEGWKRNFINLVALTSLKTCLLSLHSIKNLPHLRQHSFSERQRNRCFSCPRLIPLGTLLVLSLIPPPSLLHPHLPLFTGVLSSACKPAQVCPVFLLKMNAPGPPLSLLLLPSWWKNVFSSTLHYTILATCLLSPHIPRDLALLKSSALYGEEL